jgi:hypothetical protein
MIGAPEIIVLDILRSLEGFFRPWLDRRKKQSDGVGLLAGLAGRFLDWRDKDQG